MKKTLGIALTVAALLVGSYALASSQAPAQYVVQKGDTLWDLAGRFLGKPWHWPRIWHANPQVKNPHLIYPGDILNLTSGVTPGPRTAAPIPAIPLAYIEPFLKDVRALDSLDGLPRVVGIEEGRLRGTPGQRIYANGLAVGRGAPVGSARYDILRPMARYSRDRQGLTYAEDLADASGGVHGTAALDFDKGFSSGRVHRSRGTSVLGYELRRMSTATLVRPGQGNQAAVLSLEEGGLEVREGDILVPSSAPSYYDAVFYPHAPVNGAGEGRRVMRVIDGVYFSGPRDVVVLDAGAIDGVDVGTTYSVFSSPTPSTSDPATWVPGEFSSHLLVFRVQKHVSYALVMDGVAPTRVRDTLHHPDHTP